VVDVDGPAEVGGATARFPLDDSAATGVRASGHDGSLRVVVDLRSMPSTHAARADGAQLVIDLGDTVADPPVRAAARPPADPAPRPAAPPTVGRDQGSIRIDLALLLGAPGLQTAPYNPMVRPGDVVNVSPAGNVQVSGWVEKPGAYPVTRNLTASGAVAAAGGESFAGSPGRTRIARVLGPDEHRNFTIDLNAVSSGREADIPIVDGDVVYVPLSPVRAVPWVVYNLASAVLRFGATVPVL